VDDRKIAITAEQINDHGNIADPVELHPLGVIENFPLMSVDSSLRLIIRSAFRVV
jgi:hypothetical protein